MIQIDFNHPIKIHFIGIGGISMSGLAAWLHSKGFPVSGSDRAPSPITERLAADGIQIFYTQEESNLSDDIALAVYTAAVHPDNPEYAGCVRRGIPLMDRAELLGQISKHFPVSIGVAGTHGKTTTTSMVALMLLEAKKDPTISVGGMLSAIGGNLRIGTDENFLFEACEYTNSFLKFYPTQEIILNIDADHLDFFKDLEDIRHSFHEYALRLPSDGALIINGEIPRLSEIIRDVKARIVTYGILRAGAPAPFFDFAAGNITYDEWGHPSFDLYTEGYLADRITLSVIGEHNVSNALAAIAEGTQLGLSLQAMKQALLAFTGTGRRFEKKGEVNGVTIVDDYAHHPTEIAATLRAAANYPHKSLWCVFQPHTYTRTRLLRSELVEALSLADNIVLADIYAARETDPGDISSQMLCEELVKLGKNAYYLPTFADIEKFLLKNCVNGDLLITMGAGDIVKIGDSLLKH